MQTLKAISCVIRERERQSSLHGTQTLPDGTGDQAAQIARDVAQMICDKATQGGTLTWRDILREEVFEAFAESDRKSLRNELVQVAAVAVQWIEAIDRESDEVAQQFR